jgi:predicted lactoylglutathione lyase
VSGPDHPQTEPPTLGEYHGYPIYPMPAFVALTAVDLKATVAFFTECLDFTVMFSGPVVGGIPVLVHLRRARYQDILVRQGSAGAASEAVTVAFAVADAAAVDALQVRIERANGRVVCPAADTPWNTHELMVADPDGNRFTFTARAVQPQAQTFTETMENASRSERRGSPSR